MFMCTMSVMNNTLCCEFYEAIVICLACRANISSCTKNIKKMFKMLSIRLKKPLSLNN